MERLTCLKTPARWDSGRHPTKYTSRSTFPEVVERLAAYEDAEQDGRLVVLPCKVGDTVYVTYGEGYRPFVIDSILILTNCEVQIHMGYPCAGTLSLCASEFGKTIFFTREEAEAEATLKGGAE